MSQDSRGQRALELIGGQDLVQDDGRRQRTPLCGAELQALTDPEGWPSASSRGRRERDLQRPLSRGAHANLVPAKMARRSEERSERGSRQVYDRSRSRDGAGAQGFMPVQAPRRHDVQDTHEDQAAEPVQLSSSSSMPVPPAIPPDRLPGIMRVIVTVPTRMTVLANMSVSDLRGQLLAAGCHVANGSFIVKGSPEVVKENTLIQDLDDVRLLFCTEQGLRPRQLALVQIAVQQEVAAGGSSRPQAGAGGAGNRHPLYKTKLCHAWVQQGQCAKGDRCVHAHGPGELRQRPAEALHTGQTRDAAPKGAAGNAESGERPDGSCGKRPVEVPEVVFTVPEDEKRRREERKRRFAPAKASFEEEEEDSQWMQHSMDDAADGSGDHEEEEDLELILDDLILEAQMEAHNQQRFSSCDGCEELVEEVEGSSSFMGKVSHCDGDTLSGAKPPQLNHSSALSSIDPPQTGT